MDFTTLFSMSFIAGLVLSLSGYSIFMGFGPPSEDLRDPFEEHEDSCFFPLIVFFYGTFEKYSTNTTR
jgi:PsbN protein